MTDLERLRKKAMALPMQPGVYLMKNDAGKIIYIGKAKALRNRVSQYFGAQTNHTAKVRKMVQNVRDFDYIIVKSEFEALVLECSLIKQNKPKYNILLKDDKGYHYIKVTQSDGWKMLWDVKQKADDGAVYYGPYTSQDAVSVAVKQALDIFQLPHCAKKFPEEINRAARPCLNYYIKLCAGLCRNGRTKEEHNEAVDAAVKFVLGGRQQYLRQLEAEMNAAAEALEFEKAAMLRDRIRAVEKVSQRQRVVSAGEKNQDVFGVQSLSDKTAVCVMNFRDGTLTNTETTVIDRIEDVENEYAELLETYYAGASDFPQRICVDAAPARQAFLEESFTALSGKKVTIFVPQTGEPKTLMDMARKNASEKLSRVLAYNDKQNAALFELKEALGLEQFPAYIEAYDISNTAGQENVCGMVTFRDGRPLRRCYRRFAIKGFEGQDDYRSMAETLERRILEYEKAPDSAPEGFARKPDLILLDGGAGQVNAVQPVLDKYGFRVPVFGMVKDGKHRTRAIQYGGGEIAINDNRSLFSLVAQIQEEVHRYAVAYHHQRKKKNTLASVLTGIEGIGPKRANLLITRFGTMAAVEKAGPDELMSVPGLSAAAAMNVYLHFHPEEKEGSDALFSGI